MAKTLVNGDSEEVPQNDVSEYHDQPFRSMKQRLVELPIFAIHRPRLWMMKDGDDCTCRQVLLFQLPYPHALGMALGDKSRKYHRASSI